MLSVSRLSMPKTSRSWWQLRSIARCCAALGAPNCTGSIYASTITDHLFRTAAVDVLGESLVAAPVHGLPVDQVVSLSVSGRRYAVREGLVQVGPNQKH